ncbi:MAG: relaxase/mobilization nuclease domain-containing protein [Proteobacteria bacterium]|nr:relaxase/mobilization nuclease domain-containing protein [Pseudomonadota bacterium]
MTPSVVKLAGIGSPLLEIFSHARRGPGRRDRFSSAQVALIARTVHRAPEVMVKVLTRGGQDARAVGRHFDYLSRDGDLKLETDEGPHLQGKGAAKALVEDWDLALDQERRTAALPQPGQRRTPKLVHKLIFSMPPGTAPDKVLEAVRTLAREQFALKHRYALVLHTDEPHPHVHVVVKAMGEDGTRLNIRKETLRTWRREFARHLRAQGIAANATERTARGNTRIPKIDPIYRAHQRGSSTHFETRERAIRAEMARGGLQPDTALGALRQTRREVLRGWEDVASTLEEQRELELAAAVRRFARQMPAPVTDRDRLAAELQDRPARTPKDPERVR